MPTASLSYRGLTSCLCPQSSPFQASTLLPPPPRPSLKLHAGHGDPRPELPTVTGGRGALPPAGRWDGGEEVLPAAPVTEHGFDRNFPPGFRMGEGKQLSYLKTRQAGGRTLMKPSAADGHPAGAATGRRGARRVLAAASPPGAMRAAGGGPHSGQRSRAAPLPSLPLLTPGRARCFLPDHPQPSVAAPTEPKRGAHAALEPPAAPQPSGPSCPAPPGRAAAAWPPAFWTAGST